MADTRRSPPSRPLDLERILYEAQHRWLRPAEVCEVLSNYQKFQLTPEPPFKPPAGSLFLFDRKALRYFRKDGHNWRKKKDRKTVKEAHEKLKDGSVDVIHCYYAHGEDNENFQRRCYWMLNGELEHIVLVHYRDVTEGSKPGVSQLSVGPESHGGSPSCSSSPGFELAKGPPCSLSLSKFGNVHAVCHLVPSVLSQPKYYPLAQKFSLPGHEVAALSAESRGFIRNANSVSNQIYSEHPGESSLITHRLVNARIRADRATHVPVTSGDGIVTKMVNQADMVDSERVMRVRDECASQMLVTSTVQPECNSEDGRSNQNESRELKKLDSFGRWMDKEIGGDYDDSFMASDSGKYWNSLDTGNDDKEVSSLSRHMQLDVDSLGPSLSQEQLFSIKDYSPDWAYSGTETKVLIVGSFLGNNKTSGSTKWGCMFGEHEVAAEVLCNYAIRCTAPPHSPGRVPFYITCSNRLACSEVREFEYREKLSETFSPLIATHSAEDDMRLLLRLTRLLKLNGERKWSDCSLEQCDKCKLRDGIHKTIGCMEWSNLQETFMAFTGNSVKFKDLLIQNLLKDRLFKWLMCKVHEEGKGPHVLDDAGQGVIHLAAALGFVWAIGPIVASGVSVNFRDTRGRTALHWASYFGREETVLELVKMGAAPGAVDDPTPVYPGGKKAADLASSRGHKGIAGYLAEADLISNLSSLDVEAENAMDTALQAAIQSDGTMDDQATLRGSLAAVRKSTHAAALIQAAFRHRSFRQGQITKSSDDVSEVPVDLVTLGSLNKVSKLNHYEDYLHFAAVKIQQQYRGWKGRKEFLKIRNRIVKIQAHVRGHQVRKQYKKVVWSVSVMEKAILRWRRKGAGLRGFQAKQSSKDSVQEVDNTDEYEFLQIGRRQKSAGVEKALDRVKSMFRHPEARDQYMRLFTRSVNFKMGDKQSVELQQSEYLEKIRREGSL